MFYIYKITNKITGKFYIGRGTIRTTTYGPEHDHYFGSGKIITASISKYGKKNHTKEILETCETLAQVCERESFWIEKLDALNPEIAYNLTADSCGFTSESGSEIAKKFYASLSEEDKKALYKKRAEEMRKHVEEIRQSSKDMWTNRSSEEVSKIKQKMSEGWSEEARKAQRQRLLGSSRKGNLEYMIAKHGEIEGRALYEAWRLRNNAAANSPGARKRQKESLKKTREACPLYLRIGKEVAQPKAAISRRLKNGTISQEEAEKKLQEIELRRGILLQELQEWKNTHANND